MFLNSTPPCSSMALMLFRTVHSQHERHTQAGTSRASDKVYVFQAGPKPRSLVCCGKWKSARTEKDAVSRVYRGDAKNLTLRKISSVFAPPCLVDFQRFHRALTLIVHSKPDCMHCALGLGWLFRIVSKSWLSAIVPSRPAGLHAREILQAYL